ncbi:unnamed protein product [Spirodela intermedia]|uniref:RRM domain-containing protein n=1 Tax=Spirodela intermedia TaxID=51605 RepID=A0A7I8LGD0_SPIIN|nr:unnamed protein product [Spirodela intermedia]
MLAGAGKLEEASSESSSSRGMMRVYMGGLGDGVTDSDMRKLFSPLGRVNCIDFVRTKGRGFAYMEFTPSSEKSLAKLFSTYNGCLWKGGRLRLEKAKEHYLERLKREWAEDAEPPIMPAVIGTHIDPCSANKSNRMTNDKAQLQIFFPKLRKVKALPFKGTGKHKYSFQRIVVPSLPVHFCDCEEHSQLSEDLVRKRLNGLDDRKIIVNEEELNIMNSVMNKLLEKEASMNVAEGRGVRREDLGHPDTETPADGNKAAQDTDEEADAENLVTNIGHGNIEEVLNLMQVKTKGFQFWSLNSNCHFLFLQETMPAKRQSFRDGLISEEHEKERKQKVEPGTPSKTTSSGRDQLSPSEKSNLSSSKVRQQETEPQENDLPVAQSQGSNAPEEDPGMKSKTDQSSTMGELTTGTSWIQKSSWKELVGDADGSSTFTISHVLPGTVPLGPGSTKSGGAVNSRPDTTSTGNTQSNSSYLKSVEARKSVPAKEMADLRRRGKSKKDRMCDVGASNLDKASPGCGSNQKLETVPAAAVGIGKVHSFVRSPDSEKEWEKAKAALSGYLKRSRNGQEAPESCKSRRTIPP